MHARRDTVVDCMLAAGVLYALAAPGLAVFFLGITRGGDAWALFLTSHLGPLQLVRTPWMGWTWTLMLLAPFALAAFLFRSARAHGKLPLLCGVLVPLWLGIGALLTLCDAVLRAG